MAYYTIEKINEKIQEFGICFADEEYFGVKEKHNFQCACGKLFCATLTHVLNRKQVRCPFCLIEAKRKEKYIKMKEYIEGKGCILIDTEFISTQSHIMIICVCGKQFETTFEQFRDRNKTRCNMCKKMHRYSPEEYKECALRFDPEYEVIGDYINSHIKIQHKHNICGNIFDISPNNFFHGYGCPFCHQSKGEKKIEQYLLDKKIKHKKQYIFDDCCNEAPLRFDFAIFDDKENIIFLIEYDGEQHYFQVYNWDFEKTKKNDRIKNEYCENNNIRLIRIPYWEKKNLYYMMEDIFNVYSKL